MTTIGDVIARDLSRKIEEIVKVDQLDEHTVHGEIKEYIVTDRLREQYRTILKAIAEAPGEPHEGVGVWLSGFFGSGKSSFAKNLGYLLKDERLLGDRAADLLSRRLDDPICTDLITNITGRIPCEVVMFDVQTDKPSGAAGRGSISGYMYRALLRTLDYAQDLVIADLEQSLEKDVKLAEFEERFEQKYGSWRKRRKMAQNMNEASAVLHDMDPSTYPSADSWAITKRDKHIEVTPGFLTEKVFELASRRRSGKALVFIIDEVGGYVARNADRIDDLRKVVELLGSQSKNLLKAGKIVGPTWLIVTSQEKLEDVVESIDSKRVDLAKLQDRFRYRVDLAPADIREVATRRVLVKKEDARPVLEKLFKDHDGQLNEHLGLEGTQRRMSIDTDGFVECYPYTPHLIGLSIDIMSGIRLQPGAPRHLGGSNRTIIKQTYEMLASERTRLKDQVLGRLVTVDLIFDLVEGNLPSERRKDVDDVIELFGDGSWEARVIKVVILLEMVRDLPRTGTNISALLYSQVGDQSNIGEVREALDMLNTGQFIRLTDDGWKLQSSAEKQWDSERRGLSPRPKDRNDLVREMLGKIFSAPKINKYRYLQIKELKIGLSADGHKLSKGNFDVPLSVSVADSTDELEQVLDDVQVASRQKDHDRELHWVFALTPAVDDLVAELFRSRRMQQKYEQLSNQGSISSPQQSCLDREKQEVIRHQARLEVKLGVAFDEGTGFFRGFKLHGADLGKTRPEIFKAFYGRWIPDLYPKLEMGVCALSGDEAAVILKAANLSGLPEAFLDGERGLGLVVSQGDRQVIDVNAPVAKEVLDHLKYQNEIGVKVSGKDLENKFTGLGYGWARELVQIVLATLLRGSSIELTYGSTRYKSHKDGACHEVFTNVHAFRKASFAPRKVIDLATLASAEERLEELIGREVDIEEAAISEAFEKFSRAERERILPILATVRAHQLPALDILTEYEQTLRLGLESPSDDRVRMLDNQGAWLACSMESANRIGHALTDDFIAAVTFARKVLAQLRSELEARKPELSEVAQELETALDGEGIYGTLKGLSEYALELETAYDSLYRELHTRRNDVYETAISDVMKAPEWESIQEEMTTPLLRPLTSKACAQLERPKGTLACTSCRATVPQMEIEIGAVDSVHRATIERLIQTVAPEERVERVKVAELVEGPITSEASAEALVEALRDRLLSLLYSGARRVVVE